MAQQGDEVHRGWKQPEVNDGTYRTGLMVNNSMAGRKVEFVPARSGKQVLWYGCGPTVYDAAHMGHARTYISFDVIRRILQDYFGYQVLMCINITDIDDKIIQRSKEQSVRWDILARYWEAMFWKDMRALNVDLPDVITRVSEYIPQIIFFIETVLKRGFAYVSEESVYFDIQAFRNSSKHVYGRLEPYSVNCEERLVSGIELMQDQVDCLVCGCVTVRVLEGEGALCIVSQKKSPLDFALWKKTKEGDPFWESPWGRGRPGWHIECSAMVNAVFDFPLDIHSGGIDLRFPHHDNELAQSEAFHDQPQAVNYFLHSGHLHIKGSKMSKSLKNFTTIQDALNKYPARWLRLLILDHRWDMPMNYSDDPEFINSAQEVDKTFTNLFALMSSYCKPSLDYDDIAKGLKNGDIEDLNTIAGVLGPQGWDSVDRDFHEEIISSQRAVDEALKDNLNTPVALATLRTLSSRIHTYLKREAGVPKIPLLLKSSRFIFRILKIFGVTHGSEATLDYLDTRAMARDTQDTSVINALVSFRQQVRNTAHSLISAVMNKQEPHDIEGIKAFAKSLLVASDDVRDESLVDLGIQLEDTPEGSIWKQLTKEELLRERDRKAKELEKKRVQKVELLKQQELLNKQRDTEASIPPKDYFNTLNGDTYKTYDEFGVPVTYKDGTPISKSQRMKLQKILQKHTAKYSAKIENAKMASKNNSPSAET